MRVHVIGSSATVGFDGGVSPGYLIESGDTALLMDCGPGVVPALSAHLRPTHLAGVIISHMHFNNFYDLLPLAHSLLVEEYDVLAGMYTVCRPPVPVLLPADGSRHLQRIIDAVVDDREGSAMLFTTAIALRDYAPHTRHTIGAFTVEIVGPLAHAPGPCFGFRISDGTATVGYSGDSGPCDALATIARDADLFLCEATFITGKVLTDQRTRHLSAEEAGEIARRAGVKHLALTHLLKESEGWCDALLWAARSRYRGPVSVARAGSRFDVPFV